ncbi:aspartate:alanine exchanger family transporter [Paraburkholderia sp. DHOC27]|uniref:aspartate:alanine exchanger family transporter n=1 Tax=Paraburkholderia sp. DHOC27 TaxID=2303330 RepID=UPI000E3BB811|nr:TrkA C-terminal domain-containing protein [Paraburkholderia sp. DHOC27]RFU49396.1 YidE/YbjL duplication [Paraburkholderia sp. DHOC27]
MTFVRSLLEQQPMFALFLTIAIGYVVGEINLKGFSLGVGAVLFVALAVGWFAPKSAPAPMVGTLGLSLFLYAVGAQYGKQFFLGFSSAYGRRANLIALVGVLLSGVVSLLCMKAFQLTPGHAFGLFAGSGTSTATLQAAIAKLGNDDAAVGYSVAYPFGVAGPILLLYITFALVKPKVAVPAGAGMEILEVALADSHLSGKTLGELMKDLPDDVQIIARRRQHHNEPATPNIVLAEHDVLLMVGPDRETLERAGKTLGQAQPGRMVKDRQHLDYLRVFASRAAVVGKSVGELALPGANVAVVVHVRRGEADLLAHPDLVLESGDRVGMLANPADFGALRSFFGNSIKGTAEFSYISIGFGMALGFLLGAVSVPLPGIGKISLGLSGVLIVALIFGKLRRTGSLNWTIPLSANLVLRNLGLTLFLAQVGMASGPRFAATVSQTGLEMLALGAIILLALAIPVIVLGLFVCHMRFDQVAGIVAGACGNPAILAYASKLAPTDEPDIGYAMIFPGMTIIKILFVDIVPAFLGN